MSFQDIANHRLIFVSGKGGVGKTTVAASLAKFFASLKKRTALIEFSPNNDLLRFFNKSPIKKSFIEITPELILYRLKTDKILERLIKDRFHFKSVYKIFFDNKFVKYFLNATPGFNEFLLTTEITHLAEERDLPFDHIIVDAPATGHAIALLEIPGIITDAIHGGPIREMANNTFDLFRNHHQTCVAIVSLAEEMPSTEAKELKLRCKDIGMMINGLFLNKVHKPINKTPPKEDVPIKFRTYVDGLIRQNKKITAKENDIVDNLTKDFRKSIYKIDDMGEKHPKVIADNIITLFKDLYEL